jgi:hypothetical protein
MFKRWIVPLLAVLVALWPVAALADANGDQIALQNALKARGSLQVNALNDIARCMMAATGQVVSGSIGASRPDGAAGCAAVVAGQSFALPPTLAAPAAPAAVVSTAASKCPVIDRPLNQVEMNIIGDFLVAKTKAESNKGLVPPVPSDDVVALMNC